MINTITAATHKDKERWFDSFDITKDVLRMLETIDSNMPILSNNLVDRDMTNLVQINIYKSISSFGDSLFKRKALKKQGWAFQKKLLPIAETLLSEIHFEFDDQNEAEVDRFCDHILSLGTLNHLNYLRCN